MFPLLNADKPNPLRFFQIWLNLPARSKMCEPAFVMHWAEDVKTVSSEDGKTKVTEISLDALKALGRYDWPGNVRELENVIQSSSVVAQGKRILLKDLPEELEDGSTKPKQSKSGQALVESTSKSDSSTIAQEVPAPGPILGDKVEPNDKTSTLEAGDAGGVSMEETFDFAYACVRDRNDKNLLQAVEREVIQRCLKETGGNQVKASKLLGITRATLRKRIDLYEIRY